MKIKELCIIITQFVSRVSRHRGGHTYIPRNVSIALVSSEYNSNYDTISLYGNVHLLYVISKHKVHQYKYRIEN